MGTIICSKIVRVGVFVEKLTAVHKKVILPLLEDAGADGKDRMWLDRKWSLHFPIIVIIVLWKIVLPLGMLEK